MNELLTNLPPLTGSEKQIAWAEKIRQSFVLVLGKTRRSYAAREVAAHTDARYWIDNRYALGVTNAEQRAIQQLWR